MKETAKFDIGGGANVKKWDLLFFPGGQKAICIKVQKTGAGDQLTMYPWKIHKYKIVNYLKFKILKLKVFLKII
jgi:hypothetical protein